MSSTESPTLSRSSEWPSYLLPTLQAAALHLAIIMIFALNWERSETTHQQPQIITAKVMIDPVAVRQQEAERQAALREQQRQADAARRQAEQQAAAERKKQQEQDAARKKAEQEAARKKAEQEAARKKAEQEKAEAARRQQEDARKKAEAAKREEQEQARRLQQELDSALAEESAMLEAANNVQAVSSYAAMIQQRIVQNWSRPLSARNGMEVVLMLNLVPTGEVSNVYVLESSGDNAFDRSAIQAVQRVGKFEELQQVSPRLFDANFRQFRLRFKPEDLER